MEQVNMKDVIKEILEEIAKDMGIPSEVERVEYGVASEYVAGKIDQVNAEAEALKENVFKQVDEYKAERMANLKREVNSFVDHLQAVHDPTLTALQHIQDEAWNMMRTELNIPEHVANEDIYINNETRMVTVKQPKENANTK